MAISSTTFISDSVLFLRSVIASGTTDPISASRIADSNFVTTSYPTRVVQYPMITIKMTNFTSDRLGLTSEQTLNPIDFEVRVWGKNEQQKDDLSQQVFTSLRTKQYDSGSGTAELNLFGFTVFSANNVDEDGDGPKSRILNVRYNAIT